MPEPQPFIVGRQSEIDRFAALLEGRVRYWLLNIYGPGGIGKTVVGQKMQNYAREKHIPFAFVDGIRPDLTPDRILYAIKEELVTYETLADAFNDFEREYQEYLIVQQVLQRGGGVQAMFDVVGNLKDPAGFAKVIGSLGEAVTDEVQRRISNRFALERYLRGVERALTSSLSTELEAAVEKSPHPLALAVDTYEELEGLDDWVCRTLVPALPVGVKVVVLGRNALPKVNFDWGEFGDALRAMELPELPEGDAKAYLVHYGLRDSAALDQVYRFTGGYPLLLVLVVHLQREAGGWDQIGALEYERDRERVATKLLERILREERVQEVQAFLEKGVVARWFTPEVVSVILEVSGEEGHAVYSKLERHSFVERHPYGLKFHDKIRELLMARLKFNKPEYDRIVKRLTDYYAEKAGIKREEEEDQQPAEAKYVIQIGEAKGLVIGDSAQVVLTFGVPKQDEARLVETQTKQVAARLRQLLAERLDMEELRTLCFDLGVDFDSLHGEGKATNVRELILYLERRGHIKSLEAWLRQNRPDLTAQLDALLADEMVPGQEALIAQATSRLDTLSAQLGRGVDDLKRGLAVLYRHVDQAYRDDLARTLVAVQRGRLDQSEMQATLDALWRAMRVVMDEGLPMDAELRAAVADLTEAVESSLSLERKLELLLPLIPMLLDYKIELAAGSEVDLHALWSELQSRVRGLKHE